MILFFILRAFGSFEERGNLFYKDNSAISVEGQEVLQGEWVKDVEEGRSHRKPQLCTEEVKDTGGHLTVEKTECQGGMFSGEAMLMFFLFLVVV